MAKSRISPYSPSMPLDEFKQRVTALGASRWTPGSWLHMSETRDLLEPLAKDMYWGATRDSDSILVKHLIKANWTLSDGNFIHRTGDLYAWISSLSVETRQDIRASQFGQLSAIGYALLCDVHPERRPGLMPRLEYWSGLHCSANVPSMLVDLAEHWGYGPEGASGALGSILAQMDPSMARSAEFLSNVRQRMADPNVTLLCNTEDQQLDIPTLNLG